MVHTNLWKKIWKYGICPYDRFKNVEYFAEGGFSKIYKAIWIGGPITDVLITDWNHNNINYNRKGNMIVVLKELNNSKNISSKDLNEVFLQLVLQVSIINKIIDL
jgi:hypothetical protein